MPGTGTAEGCPGTVKQRTREREKGQTQYQTQCRTQYPYPVPPPRYHPPWYPLPGTPPHHRAVYRHPLYMQWPGAVHQASYFLNIV